MKKDIPPTAIALCDFGKVPETVVEQAWALIELLDLNEAYEGALRFCLVSKLGHIKKKPAKACAIYDAQIGKMFLPQTDAEWLEQLIARYRVSLQWDCVAEAWRAQVGHCRAPTPLVRGYGATPGFAVVAALVASARKGQVLVRQPWPGQD